MQISFFLSKMKNILKFLNAREDPQDPAPEQNPTPIAADANIAFKVASFSNCDALYQGLAL